MIKRMLIANRGEIAVRIIRTCREMGIETAVVYSTADRDSLPVLMADRAVCIGPPPSTQSYLDQNNLIMAAFREDCDAIHPGVGFLSENRGFAQLVRELADLDKRNPSVLVRYRNQKIRHIGHWDEKD